jgi:hypothetical protein
MMIDFHTRGNVGFREHFGNQRDALKGNGSLAVTDVRIPAKPTLSSSTRPPLDPDQAGLNGMRMIGDNWAIMISGTELREWHRELQLELLPNVSVFDQIVDHLVVNHLKEFLDSLEKPEAMGRFHISQPISAIICI